MSISSSPDVANPIERCRPADVTPVHLEADSLESTAPEYLRDLKRAFTREGLFPAGLTVGACFEEECSISTQHEVDRIRSYVRAGAFLGVATVTVVVEEVVDTETVKPALAACAERADREGLSLELDAPFTLEH